MPEGKMYFDVSKIKKEMTKHGDHLDTKILKDIPKLLSNPIVITEYKEDNTVSVYGALYFHDVPVVVEFDSSIDSEYIGTEFGDTNYHTVVTIFEPDVERQGMPFDYMEELLENPNNFELEIERRQSERSATQEKHPNTSNELSSVNSVPQEKDTVNSNSMKETEDYSANLPKDKRSFSLGSPVQ